MVFVVSQRPKFKSVLLQGFHVNGHFETSVPNDPKMTLSSKRSKVPHIQIMTAHDSQISLFRSTASIFQVTCTYYFETSALNDTKMCLNTKTSKAPHVIRVPNLGMTKMTF